MSQYSSIKAAVNAYIKQNGRKEITGRILNAVLNATIDSLGKFYQFAGVAVPTTDPEDPDQNVCYLAGEPGTYTHFDNIVLENEEIALLFYNGTWTKQRMLIGIQEVSASVDSQTGTPSVDVSYSEGQLVLTFHNLKGDKGDTGDPAGFGSIGATVDSNIGTPGVTVVSSGPATAKELMFNFTNLKGETGVTSVIATVDNTQGTPSCTVSLVGQQLTLAFSGLKGLKGDTGVSADYPITIYNGLDSDATDQALAAYQGKVLDGKITQLEAEVVGVTKNYGVGYYYYSNGIVDPNQTNWFHGEDYIPVNEGDEVVWNPGGSGNGNSGLCRYNANKEFLASWIGNAVERTVTIPAGVSFIRGSFMVSNFNNAKIIVNGATVWTPHDAQTGMKDTLSKVEDISNYVKSTFSVTPGTAHSSAKDTLVIEIKNGESFNVFFIETEKVTKGYVYVHYVGGSGTTLIDEILPCQSKQFTASADIDYIGIYLDGGAIKQSGDITFFACLASGLGDLLSSEMNTLKSVLEDNKTAVTETDLRDNNFNSVYNSTDIAEKCKDYSALFNNSGKCESIVFMTDPHLMGSSNTFNETTFKNYIGILQKYYNMLPIDWMVCGGDWLNNGDYQDGACWKLGYVDATMRKLFGNRYYPMLGNHDTNYQGVVSSDDSSRGDLTHQTLVNLMFRDNGNTFYEWKGNNTRFFVLDTGLDWNETMDSYRWEQVAWLANNLLANEDEHIVILMHIYYNSGTTPSVLAPIIQTLCGAFNGRTSVTLNGNTYDFTNANGTIHCIISGHSHADYIIDENVNVPVWLTANMEKGGKPTFDLLLIDYTAGKMKSIRVGTGNDREMNLA